MLERMTSNREPTYWPSGSDLFPVKNLYTAGVAGQRFFTHLKEKGEILGTPCSQCGITYVPGRLFCEVCLSRLERWVSMGLRGNLFSYTLSYVDMKGVRREVPKLLGVIRIGDGLLLHYLLGCTEESLRIGTVFEAILKPLEERRGSLLDIVGFQLI